MFPVAVKIDILIVVHSHLRNPIAQSQASSITAADQEHQQCWGRCLQCKAPHIALETANKINSSICLKTLDLKMKLKILNCLCGFMLKLLSA